MPNALGNTKTSPILFFQHIWEFGIATFMLKGCFLLKGSFLSNICNICAKRLIAKYAKCFGKYKTSLILDFQHIWEYVIATFVLKGSFLSKETTF